MGATLGILLGAIAWFLVRYLIAGIFTVDQGERAVKTSFGRAQRLNDTPTSDGPLGDSLREEERERYAWPQLKVIPPGGPYFRWPWEQVYKVKISTQTCSIAWDPDDPEANQRGTVLEAVTKDQLNTGLTGQIRYKIDENNLYAYLFGLKSPVSHVMGYFVSVLRERIANFEAPLPAGTDPATANALGGAGVSINDLRKNLRDLNDRMEAECVSASARYGVQLEASLITGIDPPAEVESALAAINTAYNQVSSDVSLAHASADQQIVLSRRAVEIEQLKVQAELEPLRALAEQLRALQAKGPNALESYRRSVRLRLYEHTKRAIVEVTP